MAPIAAVVAGAEPEMAENTSAASTVTMASPPVRWRTSVPASSTRRLRQAARGHQLAGQHEQRDRQQAELLRAADDRLRQEGRLDVGHQQRRPWSRARWRWRRGSRARPARRSRGHQDDRGGAHGSGGAPACVLRQRARPRRASDPLQREQRDQRAGDRGHAVQDLGGIADGGRDRPGVMSRKRQPDQQEQAPNASDQVDAALRPGAPGAGQRVQQHGQPDMVALVHAERQAAQHVQPNSSTASSSDQDGVSPKT